MSDFDAEAERERLREKYERDKRKRESTERMSELLLKGATMTNSHCGECGDPIFRYEGQEFCPTCEAVFEGEEGSESAGEDSATEGDTVTEGDSAAGSEDATATGDATASGDATVSGDATDTANATETTGTSADESAGATPSPTEPDLRPRTDRTDGPVSPADADSPMEAGSRTEAGSPSPGGSDERRTAPPEPTHQGTDDADRRGVNSGPSAPENPSVSTGESAGTNLAPARESLVRTVTEMARRAESETDADRVRTYLAATREAAQALRAVKDADR